MERRLYERNKKTHRTEWFAKCSILWNKKTPSKEHHFEILEQLKIKQGPQSFQNEKKKNESTIKRIRIRISSHFSRAMLKIRKQWSDVFKMIDIIISNLRFYSMLIILQISWYRKDIQTLNKYLFPIHPFSRSYCRYDWIEE